MSLLHSERGGRRVELLVRGPLRWAYELLDSMVDRLSPVTSDMLAALEHANSRLSLFPSVSSTPPTKRSSIDAAISPIPLKKHRSEIEDSLVAKSDQGLHSSTRRRDRYHNGDTDEDYDDAPQITSKGLRSPNRRRGRYRNIVTDPDDDFVPQPTSNALPDSDNLEPFPPDAGKVPLLELIEDP